MIPQNPEPTELELLALADGRLAMDSERGRQIRQWLTRNAATAARIAGYAAQDQVLRRHYNPVMSEPLPPRLRPARIRAQVHSGQRRWMGLAASLGVLVVSAAAWTLRAPEPATGEPELDRFVQQISQQIRLPRDTATSTGTHVEAPDLPGFSLTGSRQLDLEGRSVDQIEYHDADGHHLSLFVGQPPSGPSDPVRWHRIGEERIVYWRQHGRLYALAGDLPRDRLELIATGAVVQVAGRQFAVQDAAPLTVIPTIAPTVTPTVKPDETDLGQPEARIGAVRTQQVEPMIAGSPSVLDAGADGRISGGIPGGVPGSMQTDALSTPSLTGEAAPEPTSQPL